MEKKTFKDLEEIAEKLRSETGCPWDKKQTIASMLKYIDEEVSEVREAIENGDHENLKEELGDVMFQLIMVAQIAKEQGYFKIDDVVNDVGQKVVSRHTWVFGDDTANTPEEALVLWKRNKEIEKSKKK